uniref:Uncharacterized protein n=1 Tax=Rhizophora mucronata TaxID=61149 RepID=A0A2P2QKB6_RHIMU
MITAMFCARLDSQKNGRKFASLSTIRRTSVTTQRNHIRKNK